MLKWFELASYQEQLAIMLKQSQDVMKQVEPP